MKKAFTLCIILMILSLSACSGTLTNPKESTSQEAETLSTTATEQIPSETTSLPPATTTSSLPGDSEYVKVTEYVSSIFIDLKYATVDNFTGQVIYGFSDAYLRYGTVQKTKKAQETARLQGYSLKIWDAYRPLDAQYALWTAVPDPTYVADPRKGPSGHNMGNCIDVTLVNTDGTEIYMPTAFDDFSLLADRDYSDVSYQAAQNALLLESIMYSCGFTGYKGEWWDYTDSQSYEYTDFIP
ncbi:M15 family metallopeptidase [Parasporobacterium paucivorans]|uniref:D-alanyl-D-alanine dipeptidase n=1 Tax=Parasporobacterium paucivorans DSM 15970 TaxID=1122934 RepID=A0A1M6DLG9_9FIRM|nr:M15 family metallopeptidase [Parasporobacterium paucivorans]SHI73838.1 D-alanyl-D-alanine dipeptidase [Parasporobacterium paucivorans DSM 15970]